MPGHFLLPACFHRRLDSSWRPGMPKSAIPLPVLDRGKTTNARQCLKWYRPAFAETPRLIPFGNCYLCDKEALDLPARQRRRCRHAWIDRIGIDRPLVVRVSGISRQRKLDPPLACRGPGAPDSTLREGRDQNSIVKLLGAQVVECQQGYPEFLSLSLSVGLGQGSEMNLRIHWGGGFSAPPDQKEKLHEE